MTIDKRVGIIGLPGRWSTEALADALEARTGFRLVVDIRKVTLDLEHGALWFQHHNLCDLDALAIKKISPEYSPATLERLDLLRVAEAAGVRCFSPVRNVHRLIDRLGCTLALASAGIAMPETTVTEQPDVALEAVHRYGQAILKPLFSTRARGMVLLDSAQTKKSLARDIARFQEKNPILYIQRRYELSGQDHGIVFLGGNYLCSYSRVAARGHWNTTTDNGGKYRAYEPSAEVIELAHRAQAEFDLDYTTVDVAITREGPMVFEVSAFGGFRGTTEGAGLDAAALYSDYILNTLDRDGCPG